MSHLSTMYSREDLERASRYRRLGLVLAPTLAAVVWWIRPENMSHPAAALMALIAGTLILWMTEALPLGVTALAAPAVGVMLGIATPEAMFRPFSDPIVFLFLGAAFLNEAAERRRLDRAIAAALFPKGRTTLRALVRSVSVIACVLSAVAPNRSVAAMMLPVLKDPAKRFGLRFERLGLLGVAWSTSVGGMLTAVGAPANLVAIAAIAQYDGRAVPLLYWTLVSVPVVLSLVGLWVLLSGVVLGVDGLAEVHGDLRLQPIDQRRSPTTEALRLPDTVPLLFGLDRGQAVIATVGLLCMALWWAPGVVALFTGVGSPAAIAAAHALPPGIVALLGAVLLFAAPAGLKRKHLRNPAVEPVLSWPQARSIRWAVVLLLGCGLALGHQSIDTGLSRWLGHLVIKGLGVDSQLGLAMLMTGIALAMTQIASDTVTAAVLCPLAVVSAQQINVSPVAPCLSVGMAASVAVLFPQSTDTTSMVFRHHRFTLRQFVQRGVFPLVSAGLIIPPVTVAMVALLGLG